MSKYKELLLSNSTIANSKNIISKLNDFVSSNDIHNSKHLLYELISFTVNQQVPYEVFTSISDTMIANKELSSFLTEYLTEIIWLNGMAIAQENKEQEIKIYSNIVNYYLNQKIINKDVLLERLEETTLAQCGIVPNQTALKNHITRINTKLNYEQQKYNLLREESEGFSKLVYLLFEFGDMKIENDNQIKMILDKVICLIGFFDLDPTRVLDITIEAFQNNPYNTNFLLLFNILNKKVLPHVIGFKLRDGNNNLSFFIVIAQMIKSGLIQIEDIFAHLTPTLANMEKSYAENNKAILNYCKEGLSNKIASELRASNALASLEDGGSSNMTKNANYFCNFEEILNEAYNLQSNKGSANNQIVLLLEGLIKIKDKVNTERIINVIGNYYDPMMRQSLVKTLCELVSWMIEPLYSKYRTIDLFLPSSSSHPNVIQNKNEYNQISSLNEFLPSLSEVLKILSIGLSTDQILFQKLLTIISNNISQLSSNSFLHDLIVDVFLPCLSLIDPTPSLVNLLWSILSSFPYNVRYNLYNEWYNNVYLSHPYLYMKYIVVSREIGKWQKGLSKENQRQYGRILSIISNSNPIIVFDNIIKLLTSYSNQINFFISSLSFCSPLSFDVISFVICRLLSEPSRKKTDTNLGDVLTDQYKNLCDFIGNFYKKYHNVEINGILNYIINRFKNDTVGIEIYVLKEMIEKMVGIKCQDILNEGNYYSDCGGLYLYLENMGIGKEYKYYKRASSVLSKYFTSIDESKGNSISQTLLLLFLLKKRFIIYNNRETSVKLLCFYSDIVSSIYYQFLTFVDFYIEDNHFYEKILKTIKPEDLIIKYHLSPVNVFELYRKTLKPINEQSPDEYNTNCALFSKIFDTYQSTKGTFLKEEFDSSYLQKEALIDDIYKPIWKYISPELYYIFNALDIKDIYFPSKLYEKEIEKLNKEKDRIISNSNNNDSNNSDTTMNNTNTIMNLNPKTRKEIDKINTSIENLNKEIKTLKSKSESILTFLKTKINILNEIPQQNKRDIPQYLIQYLLYPRLIRSKNDALYTVKFLTNLFMMKLPMLNVLDIIQKISKYILPCILCVTEHEAGNIGLFLNEFLKTLKSWQEEKYWNDNCKTNPSFSRKLDVIEIVEYNDFKKAFVCILGQMSNTFKNIFATNDDYMNVRNAMNVLRMISLIPPTKETATDLVSSLEICCTKFGEYKDSVLFKRYKDNLNNKLDTFPSHNGTTNETKSTNNNSNNNNNNNRDKSYSGDRKKRRERSRDRDKRNKDDSNRNNTSSNSDVRKRSPEQYSRKKK